MNTYVIALALAVHACTALASPSPTGSDCKGAPFLRTDRGMVCGMHRLTEDGVRYASFRGVPYAKQPVGPLRFKELVPADHWDVLNATHEGPICLQTEVLYGRMMNRTQVENQNEACIYANIHVPLDALPLRSRRQVRELLTPVPREVTSRLLPILVFIHGGGFAFGSGDADLHGPEYLVRKNIIVITFNYRLNVFGFLSLKTTQIPGNAGLRDQVTLLNWVRRNAKYFGGDPDDVTIAGQSAGAVSAHLLTLSPATEGLFKRAILMSGTAASTFYSSSPTFAGIMSRHLLTILGITSTDPDDIHRQLINLPAETLRDANKQLLDMTGLTTFVPTVEKRLPGVTTIIDDDPETLLANGRGKNIPLFVGFTSAECETFRKRLEEFDLLKKVQANPALIIPPSTFFKISPKLVKDVANKVNKTYFHGTITMDKYVKSCSDAYYEYPALKLAKKRAETGGAPVFLYRFAYEGRSNVVKEATGQNYKGVGHIEDLTYVFRANAVRNAPGAVQPSEDDISMKNLMTEFFGNFTTCSKPICEDPNSKWPADNGNQVEDIESPTLVQSKDFSQRQLDIINFFDSLNNMVLTVPSTNN